MKRRILIIVFTLMILASNVGTTFAEGFKNRTNFLKAKREEKIVGGIEVGEMKEILRLQITTKL